jgi:predicted nucleic-acid-binding Zn-ribbon protein
MKDGHCPMCGSNEVWASLADNFRAGPNLVDVTDELTFAPYLCRSCGFTAMYVDDPKYLDDLSEDWTKV